LALKARRRLMTVKLLALSAAGMVGIMALVAIGLPRRRQPDVDMEGPGSYSRGECAGGLGTD
jgi:hypothetical protein